MEIWKEEKSKEKKIDRDGVSARRITYVVVNWVLYVHTLFGSNVNKTYLDSWKTLKKCHMNRGGTENICSNVPRTYTHL